MPGFWVISLLNSFPFLSRTSDFFYLQNKVQMVKNLKNIYQISSCNINT